MLAYTGAQVELSVPTVSSPDGWHFSAKDLARLAPNALEEQAQGALVAPRKRARLAGRR